MSKFEEIFKQTEMYKALSQDALHSPTLLLRHHESNGKSLYLNPFTRLAEEMFALGYEAGKADSTPKPAHFDPVYTSNDVGMNASDKPVTTAPPRKEKTLSLPHFFSQLHVGMKVKFKGGGVAIISELVEPDDQGQSFYGIAFVRDENHNTPKSLEAGYVYSYGTKSLIQGRCDNDEALDIEAVLIREDLIRSALNLRLGYIQNNNGFGEPHPDNQQAYVYFGYKFLVAENKDLYYCRANFHKGLKRPPIAEQADNPKDLLRALEAHLGTFFGVQEVIVAVDLDTLRKDLSNYTNILQYGIPRLFLNKHGT